MTRTDVAQPIKASCDADVRIGTVRRRPMMDRLLSAPLVHHARRIIQRRSPPRHRGIGPSPRRQTHAPRPLLFHARNGASGDPSGKLACCLPAVSTEGAYLVAVMDWFSRRVLAWRLSIGLDMTFCVEALQDAMDRCGPPDIFNTDSKNEGVGGLRRSKVGSSPAAISLMNWRIAACGSAWTAKGGFLTTSSSSAFGAA